MMRTDGIEDCWRSERPSMVRAIYLVCGDLDLAAEIVDQTFLNVMSRLRRGSIEDLTAYLWRSAFNECNRTTKRRSRQTQRAPAASGDIDRVATSGTEADIPHDLSHALSKLNVQTRTVLVLRFYRDLSGVQIADELQIPVGTVRSIIHRGLAALRNELLTAERTTGHG